MRKKKHFYTVICLIAGVILLTTAAAANYGNANGYPLYKSALKQIMYEDNFTASLKFELIYDGETTQQTETHYMLDAKGDVIEYTRNGTRTYLSNMESDEDIISERWEAKNTSKSETEAEYLSISRNGDNWYIHPSYRKPWTSPAEDEFTRKAIRFVELIADTFVGDLKNNFVQTSNSDGLISYQIVLSGNQLPEYVSAGLSMIFSAAKDSSGSYVFYDPNFNASGEEASEISSKAWEQLNEKGNTGVIFVAADGSLHYFVDMNQYYESDLYQPNMDRFDDILRTLNSDPKPETAKCFITLDEDGRLRSNIIEGTISSYDKNGEKHTLGIRITAAIDNYGTTVIDYPEIPKDHTVYDYSELGPNKEYSVKVTKDGVVRTVTQLERIVEDTEIVDEIEVSDSTNE
ncbi:MAG: hypothetical protein ACOX1Q_02300 [Eubacteriales bacterium]|jgi:hypothetical protein